jgi:high-affinity Fe2+/Pb2+ permease
MQQEREGMQESLMAGGAAGATAGAAAGGVVGWGVGMVGGALIELVAGIFLVLAIARSNRTNEHT